ncbi:MAG: carbamoyl-phosphate synthase large subunit [Planctomycetota bacterium]|nr:MAG: carbamoyl-phosphate synthase large subunit [Planctomycetota bacterium]REJ87902.1 MAG: carbamoyl-phosphate synthase large subunit [Planctomycetota bacterium]REK26480.1 MAG: carbamoyl-phosphate synthase large subunit [Planctomycetota bacterium]REK38731.1 MAG: carbamoyl-phosphate synthase large subunit [Planctomycetota bacterium]
MPRRQDIHKILIIGSGPIVIGQACEFDYSGTQACKALREEGFEVVLVNSNPATIMTDPGTAHRTYIEPLTWEVIAKLIEAERPDALLPTLGGQTGLNLAMQLQEHGVLEQFGVEMIGARADVIAKAEERDKFKRAMESIGLEVCRGETVNTVEEARQVLDEIGLPCVVRPSFTMGGSGSSIAYNRSEFDQLVRAGLDQSPVTEVLIEESIIGWKEFEMEVMRDADDNVVIICAIENFDPMGVHTGDSITVAPAQTLTDKEYQRMRDASLAVIREIGVETGGSNIQFAINPRDGRMIVIEMNPRVSRSSALASKATGFPIAKIAAKLAVGYRLYELPNDITRETRACFEPTIDYVVTKIPRFAFEKFPEADAVLTTQMKSVGETMAIGRTFKESFQKALRGLEVGSFGFGCDGKDLWGSDEAPTRDEIRAKLAKPNCERVWYLRYALKSGMSIDEIYEQTWIDPWFLDQLSQLVELEEELRAAAPLEQARADLLRRAKRAGFSDRQLATVWQTTEMEVRARRKQLGIIPTFKSVDTCAAEFEAYTPYYYSTYEEEDETPPKGDRKRIIILGGGPNRIGQGIEFDYCCCHAAYAMDELGFESVMVNSNPETVSTDYDTSDLLFFEPLTTEDVLNICDRVEPAGVIVQFGGQTPLNLARGLANAGVPIIGTSVDTIEAAEDREKFQALLSRLGLNQPANGIARTMEQARTQADRVGYPVLVRPSFVLGGRAMEICYDRSQLETFVKEAFIVAQGQPVLIDRFLEDAIEVDVDCICDGASVIVAGVMEHIEEAGVHSGDSACAIPPYSLPGPVVAEIRQAAHALAHALGVVGLMNIQFAVKRENGEIKVYVLEVNPRASRTVPFVAKAVGVPVAKIAAKVMAGCTLAELGLTEDPVPTHVSVKESVFPFIKFVGVDIVLGPEMKSTGEVMGISERFSIAFAKSQLAAGVVLPCDGKIFLSVAARAKDAIADIARRLDALGYQLIATDGTAHRLQAAGIEVEVVRKIQEGHPNLLDYIANEDVRLILNTPSGKGARTDEGRIRAAAVASGVPCITTIQAADACVRAMEALREEELTVQALQDRFPLDHDSGQRQTADV